MKFLAVAALFAGALAIPTAEIEARTRPSTEALCPIGLHSSLYCADSDAGQAVCFNAHPPSRTPNSPKEFENICIEQGQKPYCGAVQVADQAISCEKPTGVSN